MSTKTPLTIIERNGDRYYESIKTYTTKAGDVRHCKSYSKYNPVLCDKSERDERRRIGKNCMKLFMRNILTLDEIREIQEKLKDKMSACSF